MTSTVPGDDTQGKTTERLNEIAFAFKNAAALLAAVELDLFTAISNGAGTNAEIGKALGLDAEIVDRLVIVCRTMQLVGLVDGRYVNFADVERYLVRGKRTYFGDFLIYTIKEDWPSWTNLTEHLTGGDEAQDAAKYYLTLMQDPAEARRFTESGYNASLPLAHRLAKQFDFSRFSKWLDLGGGSGCYAIAACERNPALKVVVMDLPNVLTVTGEFVAKHGLSDRISTTAGNFFEADYPTGCDLISFITPLQNYMPDEVVFLLKKAYAALPDGGAILIVDYMLDDAKDGSLDPALYNLQGVRHGQRVGRVNSGAEFRQYLGEAGFRDIDVSWLLAHQLGVICGWKRAA